MPRSLCLNRGIVSPVRLGALLCTLTLVGVPAAAAAEASDSPAEVFRDALDIRDAELALERLATSPGDAASLGCVEALLLERRLANAWRPPAPADDLRSETVAALQPLIMAGLHDLVPELERLRAAYLRCQSSRAGARPTAQERDVYADRLATLDELAPRVAAGDASSFDSLDAPRELDSSFETIQAIYDAAPGVPAPAPERASLPGWRATPVILSGLVMMAPVITVVALGRGGHDLNGRQGMAALGVGLSGLTGVIVGRSWLRGSERLLWVGGGLTAATLATGALTLGLKGPRRRHAFGAAMLAGGALDLAWWIGGLVLTRRDQAAHREWLRSLRPTLALSSTGAQVGLGGRF